MLSGFVFDSIFNLGIISERFSHNPLYAVNTGMTMKTCVICNVEKTISEFGRSKPAKDGLENRCKQCESNRRNAYRANHKESQKIYMENWRENNVEAWRNINQRSGMKKYARQLALTRKIREDNPCVVCGESRVNCLEFHHIDPLSKIRGIAVYQGRNKLKEELGKCLVLCSNCHALFHRGEVSIPDGAKPIDVSLYVTD